MAAIWNMPTTNEALIIVHARPWAQLHPTIYIHCSYKVIIAMWQSCTVVLCIMPSAMSAVFASNELAYCTCIAGNLRVSLFADNCPTVKIKQQKFNKHSSYIMYNGQDCKWANSILSIVCIIYTACAEWHKNNTFASVGGYVADLGEHGLTWNPPFHLHQKALSRRK